MGLAGRWRYSLILRDDVAGASDIVVRILTAATRTPNNAYIACKTGAIPT
jgi:hypothetical protein